MKKSKIYTISGFSLILLMLLFTVSSAQETRVAAGTKITVAEGTRINVSGNIKLSYTASLLMKATDANPSNDGILNVSGTASALLTSEDLRYHFISSPVPDATAAVFYTDPPSYWLRDYDATNNTWGDWIYELDHTLSLMKGYSVWKGSADKAPFSVTFAGQTGSAFNSGSFGAAGNMINTGPQADCGWNLVGNPYPCAINWESATGWTKTNLYDNYYIWNNGNYAVWNGTTNIGTNGATGIIPAMQAFFVLVNATSGTNGTLMMDNRVRTHSNQAFFKSSPENLIRIKVEGNGMADETAVLFHPLAAETTDIFDSPKLPGQSDAPSIFTRNDNENIAINCFNQIGDNRIVPLYFLPGSTGKFTLSITAFNFNGDVAVYLEDKLTGTTHRILNNGQTFAINASEGDLQSRFILKFSTTLGNETHEEALVRIWSYQKQINVMLPFSYNGQAQLGLYDLNGRLLINRSFAGGGTHSFDAHLPTGWYIVRLVAQNRVYNQKVFVQK